MRAAFLLLLLCCTVPATVFCQVDTTNILSPANRAKFAQKLENTGNFMYASAEWHSAFASSKVDSMLLHAARCLRYQFLYDSAVKILILEGKKRPIFQEEWIKNRILAGDWIASKLPPVKDSLLVGFLNLLLRGELERAEAYYLYEMGNSKPKNDKAFNLLVRELKKSNEKSLTRAIVMSSLVPGSGKIYTGHVRDGVVSLLAVGANTLAAVVSFKDKGVTSFWGWTFSAIALGFYAGNIYGTDATMQRDISRVRESLSKHAKQYTHIYFLNH